MRRKDQTETSIVTWKPCTLEIEFDYHHGDQAILRAERATSSTTC